MAKETLDGSIDGGGASASPPRPTLRPALVVVWSQDGSRLGEVLLPDQTVAVFGRSDDSGSSTGRLVFVRQRPGTSVPTGESESPFLSREQLRISRTDATVAVECLGRRPMLIGGVERREVVLRPGDAIEVKGIFVFLCIMRPDVMDRLVAAASPQEDFGNADAFGVVGESALTWSLRDRMAFTGARHAHVLVTGESGVGKELVARSIHAASERRARKLVARSAATIPGGILDAELFGNVANYPNAGTPERPGLIGEVDGSTLFLDEIGELSSELQAHLLRVLDEGGEYQRLGDAKVRRSSFRLVGATNRAPEALKHDLLARLALRVHVCGLNERREDIPLIARHLLQRTATKDPHIGQRFFAHWNGTSGEPRIASNLMLALVRHQYTTHVRELDAALWSSLMSSRGGFLDLTDEVSPGLDLREETPASGCEISETDLRSALREHAWVRDKVWRALELPSRHALRRLMVKHGIRETTSEEG